MLNWILGFFDHAPDDWHGSDDGGLTLVHVLRAKEGDADGGMVNFFRAVLGANNINPPGKLSPAGWYAVSYSNAVGYGKKFGPFDTADMCKAAFQAALDATSNG